MTDRDLLEQIGKLRFRVQELEAERDAARDKAIEEAANLSEDTFNNHGWNYHLPSVGREMAHMIRALKSKSE